MKERKKIDTPDMTPYEFIFIAKHNFTCSMQLQCIGTLKLCKDGPYDPSTAFQVF